MKNESVLKYYIYNGDAVSTGETRGFDKVGSTKIYEVIRVIKGSPLYLEEHLERMRKSTELIDWKIDKTNKEITEEIMKLIEVNDCKNMNIKLIYSKLDETNKIFLIYFIKSSYPKKEIYDKGIHTILFHSERENPNAKIINATLRNKVNDKIKEEGAFEALLVNENNFITEGSRSNIFFVKKDKVYTAPAGEVLIGVTRSKVAQICKELNIEVVEEHVSVEELDNMDGAFMTGTSVNVLPITTIDDRKYNSIDNKIIKTISNEYKKDMEGKNR